MSSTQPEAEKEEKEVPKETSAALSTSGETVEAATAETAQGTGKAEEEEAAKSNTTAAAAAAAGGGDDVDDLDDLLDDFADDILSKPPGSTVNDTEWQSQGNAKEAAQAPAQPSSSPSTNPLGDDFQKSIADLIQDMKIEDRETQEQFETLVKQFEVNHRAEVEAEEAKPANFEYVMKETMERLRKSGQDIDSKIQKDPLGSNPEDILTQLLAGMGGDASLGGGDMDMSKLLVEMLEQLSSKDVLYEPIKDLNSKFPKYLEENKDKLEQSKLQNYEKQYAITKDILKIFESSDYSDSNQKQRDEVNSLLESLQELGQPPSELVGDSGDFLPGLGGGSKSGAADPFGFSDKDLPPDLEKNLQEGCQQQ
ncbi:uncharacterized protein LODBEIA_P18020 [Lodderomyces beijingensis]|uniref:Uncharacterized protein n=1 Tax=Lodderomyces beijingensis TaxID=1775926 RepID=A0ABP0ZIW4_9ASCO